MLEFTVQARCHGDDGPCPLDNEAWCGQEKKWCGEEKHGAEKRKSGAEKRKSGAEKRNCTLGPPYLLSDFLSAYFKFFLFYLCNIFIDIIVYQKCMQGSV